MTVRSLHCTLAAAAAAALLGACGSSSPSPTFSRDFRAQEAALVSLSGQLSSVLQSASQQTDLQLARQLKPLATGTDRAVRRLETLAPPTNVSSDFGALRSALNRRVTDLHAIIAGLKRHDANAAKSATQSLLLDSASATSAQHRIDSKLG